MAYTQYRAPAQLANEDAKLGWLREAVQEGTNLIEQSGSRSDLVKVYNSLLGIDSEKLPKNRSLVTSRRTKRQIRETIGTLCDLRNVWTYKTDNKGYDINAAVLTKISKAWWHMTFADMGMRAALQYAAVGGTGYLSPTWVRDYWSIGRGEIVLEGLGPGQVLPIQLPENNDLQRAYAVVIKHEMPISLAHALHPLFIERIVPDRDTPTMLQRAVEKMARFVSPVLQHWGPGQNMGGRKSLLPTVDIFHVYIWDRTLNMTPSAIPMGEPETSWAYTVPPYGSDIPAGTDAAGNPLTRKAAEPDSMMYPMRRLMVATRSCVISDGSSPWWHSRVPVVPIKLEDWAWEFLGSSPAKDGVNYDESLTKHMRNIDDVARAKLQPAMQYDKGALAKSDIEALDTRQANVKIGVDMTMGEPIKPLLPAEFYEVPAYIPEYMQSIRDEQDYVLATKDMAAFAKARSLPAGDVQQIEEYAGPIVKDMSRGLERSLSQLGYMMKYNFFQYYTAPRRMQLLGSDGFTTEDFDFEPGNMIPARMPWEPDGTPSKFSYFQRAREHSNNFFYFCVPGSLHQITQMSQKLLYLQLQRSGFPMDPWTLAEVMDIPNFGPAPNGTTNVMERWVAWQKMQVEQAIDLQQKMAAIQAAAQQGTDPNAAATNLMAQILARTKNNPGGGPPARNQGRQPTAQKAPHIETKDGGTRSTIAES